MAARWRAHATHLGEYVGVPPTGKQVEFTGISMYRIEGGRIAESWTVKDELSLMCQIGDVSEPGRSG